MAIWRDAMMGELARQLTYSGTEKRQEELRAAEEWLGQLDVGREYPWEFVLLKLTGYRPKEISEHRVKGEDLRWDLGQLIEFLSETLDLKSTEAGEAVMTLEEVTKRFSVSSKTIQRWRRRGLIARRYVFPDGRRRIGFAASAVGSFAEVNAERVEKSARFRPLTEVDKATILRWSRRLAGRCQCCIKDISRRVARKLGRSPETIRYTIRRYDQDHPETAIFPGLAAPIRSMDRAIILDCFDRGVPVEVLARRYCRTRSSIYRVVGQERAEKLKALPIELIMNPLFEHPDADEIILQVLPREALAKAQATEEKGQVEIGDEVFLSRTPRGLPEYLAEIFRQPVMPAEIETDTFRRMNYLKYKARKLQQRLDVLRAASSDLAEVEAQLAQANVLRNQLVQANLRVGVHVARKHQRPGMELGELVSDATITIMRAVERFDFARGVKFSTYASYAVMKNFARDRGDQIARRDGRMVTGQEERLDKIGERETTGVMEQVDAMTEQGELAAVIRDLPERERALLMAHYGLEQTQRAMSLAELGQKLGITKSRVRQLETRALRKLRRMLEERRRGGVSPENASG